MPKRLSATVDEDSIGIALRFSRMETRDEWFLSSDWIRSIPE